MLVAAQEQEQNLASTAIRVSIKRVRLFAPTAFFFPLENHTRFCWDLGGSHRSSGTPLG